VVAVIQRIELQDKHLHVQWGSVPDWVQAVGTIAAFGALLYAAREWRDGQTERRDREADQARLVLAERYLQEFWGGPPSHQQFVVVRNHGRSPVVDVELQLRSPDSRVHTNVGDFPVRLWGAVRWPVLEPGETTDVANLDIPFDMVNEHDDVRWTTRAVDLVVLNYTDAHGRRWQRIGSDQPVRVFGRSSSGA
jgi:hypothetical protein